MRIEEYYDNYENDTKSGEVKIDGTQVALTITDVAPSSGGMSFHLSLLTAP
jgi:hypothetical protein